MNPPDCSHEYKNTRCLNCEPLKSSASTAELSSMDTLTMTLTACPNCKRVLCPLHATFVTAVERGHFGPLAGYLDAANDCVSTMANRNRITTATLGAIRAKAENMVSLGITRSLENTITAQCGKEILDLLDRDY